MQNQKQRLVTVPGIPGKVADWTGDYSTFLHYAEHEYLDVIDAATPQGVVDEYLERHRAATGEQFVIN